MQAIDNAVLRTMYNWGEAVLILQNAARAITELGGARFLLPVSIVAGVWLFARGDRRRAITFWFVTIAGRAVLELAKFVIDRNRPAPSGRIVDVFSQSFPSGHAANATIVYLALALIVAPRVTSAKWPLLISIVLAFLIGLTRPMLGVHWPSDVVAGWCLGIAWTLTAVLIFQRWVGDDPRTAPEFVSR